MMPILTIARLAARLAALACAALALPSGPAGAQTDYFNTDRGRPLRVQDATAIEQYAFELQAAPLRWERASGPHVVLSIEPELAYGVLPRTQLEVGLPIYFTDGFATGRARGIGALEVSLLHALNVETLRVPGLALEASVAIPAGDFGARGTYTSIGAMATRTTGIGRVHANAQYTAGETIAPDEPRLGSTRGVGLEELSRWEAGVAVDRAFPLRSLLIGAELVARQPVVRHADTEWSAAAGVRWQLDPAWAVDAGIGRRLTGERAWSITFGAAYAFGLITLFPLSR